MQKPLFFKEVFSFYRKLVSLRFHEGLITERLLETNFMKE